MKHLHRNALSYLSYLSYLKRQFSPPYHQPESGTGRDFLASRARARVWKR